MAISFLAGIRFGMDFNPADFHSRIHPCDHTHGLRPGLVLRVVPDHYSNQLPYAANGTCDFLLERH